MSAMQHEAVEAIVGGLCMGDGALMPYVQVRVYAARGRRWRLLGLLEAPVRSAMSWARDEYREQLRDGEILRLKYS
jgi:hypothetical protein